MKAILVIVSVLAVVWAVASHTDPVLADGAYAVLKSRDIKLFFFICLCGAIIYKVSQRAD